MVITRHAIVALRNAVVSRALNIVSLRNAVVLRALEMVSLRYESVSMAIEIISLRYETVSMAIKIISLRSAGVSMAIEIARMGPRRALEAAAAPADPLAPGPHRVSDERPGHAPAVRKRCRRARQLWDPSPVERAPRASAQARSGALQWG
jgi:hypothetical protein